MTSASRLMITAGALTLALWGEHLACYGFVPAGDGVAQRSILEKTILGTPHVGKSRLEEMMQEHSIRRARVDRIVRWACPALGGLALLWGIALLLRPGALSRRAPAARRRASGAARSA
ncbi:MAG: hypothetical protein HY293_18810 [Planctomycetes bacterium]|nr:hypothetical protein [Planctomycetota bacterium]